MEAKVFINRRLGVSKLEFFIFAPVLVFSFFSFQHSDIIIPAGSSFAILQGHFLDFYDFNKPLFIQNNYLISTYLLYAIWNIPVAIFQPDIDVLNPGAWLFYFKALSAVFYFLIAVQIRKMALLLGFNKQLASLSVLFWVSCPLAFFSNFIFGQNDVFTLFFIMMALNKLLQRKIFFFTILISISLTFKYFPLFIYIPLLLAIEKRPIKIIQHFILLSIPILVEVLIFIGSQAFVEGVMEFKISQSLFNHGLFHVQYISIVAFIFFWAIAILYSFFFIDQKSKNLDYKLIFLVYTILVGFFALGYWHPQWIILMTPFAVITTLHHKNRVSFWFLDIFKMLFFVAFVVNFWQYNVDAHLLNLGVLTKGNPVTDDHILMTNFFVIKTKEVLLALFLGVLVFELIAKSPRLKDLDIIETGIHERKLLIARFVLGVSFFIIPALLSWLLPTKPRLIELLSSYF